MSYQILNKSNYAQLRDTLSQDGWVIACLCANWCGSCRDYASAFATWADRHPEYYFTWIDIEDEADLIGDIDVDNFPTLLIQRGTIVVFCGAMEPDIRLAERLLQAQTVLSLAELQAETAASVARQRWQEEFNLQKCLASLPLP